MPAAAVNGVSRAAATAGLLTLQAKQRPTGTRILLTLATLAGAIAASAGIAVANVAYFEMVNGFVGARDAVSRGVIFSSWLLLLGLPIVSWRPARFAFTIGELPRHGRLVVAMTVGAGLITWILLAIVGTTPYSAASPFIEIIDVPITEELLFRGVFLSALITVLRRLHPTSMAAFLAIIFDGIAFGGGHIANALELDLAFVAMQVTFATMLGTACAFLVVRTGSIYPAMLVHAVVNAVVVFV